MTVECDCKICKGKAHWKPPKPPEKMHVGSWRYQSVPLTQEQIDAGQYVTFVGWMVPDTRLQAIADAWMRAKSDTWDYDDTAGARRNLRHEWPELADLFDGLTKEDTDD